MDIHDKIVVITGASKGIGAATARAFVKSGAKVVLAARSVDLLDKLVAELGADHAWSVWTDMTHYDDVAALMQRTVDHFGRIDIVVNNAGVGLAGDVASLSIQSLKDVLELNLFGPLYAIQEAVSHMKNSGGGLIINISSMVTKLPLPIIGGYRASKMALDAISDSARIELASYNIRVVTVYPGATDTEFNNNVIDKEKAGDRMMKGIKRQSAAHVARKIVEAARNEPRVQYMGLPMRAVAFLGAMAPGFLERAITRGRKRGH
jgi:short-subunit dehydrogenase